MLRIAVSGLAVAVIAVVGLASGWYFLVRDDAEPLDEPLPIPEELLNSVTPTPAPTGAVTATSAPTITAVSSASQAWTIVGGESEADYYVGETLASIGVPSTANGKTTDISGTFYLSAGGTALDTGKTSSFTVDLTTLQSDEDRRDNRVQQALETGTYPAATFTATSISGLDTSAIADGATVTFELNGTLELHGVSQDVSWEVEATRQANVISAIANLDIAFADYGITPPNIGGFVSVEDTATLQAVIIAQQS